MPRIPAPLTDSERARLGAPQLAPLPTQWGPGDKLVGWAERRHHRCLRVWGLARSRTAGRECTHVYWPARLANPMAVAMALQLTANTYTLRTMFRARGNWARLDDDWCRAAARLYKLALYDYEQAGIGWTPTAARLATWAESHLTMENGR